MRGVTHFLKRIKPLDRKFQLTRLMRGVTLLRRKLIDQIEISTHTPHARRDLLPGLLSFLLKTFQLTRLMRGVTSGLSASRVS